MKMQNTKSLVLAVLIAVTSSLTAQPAGKIAMQDRYQSTRSGVKIHYFEADTTKGMATLVFIPGWRLPAFLWKDQMEHFATLTRVIAIDSRSQGETSIMAEGNTPETRAEDLHEFLASVGGGPFILIGWSQGAQDVAAYLDKFGTESIAGVVFVDSPVSAGPSEISIHPEFSQAIVSGVATYIKYPAEYSKGMVQSLFRKPHPNLDLDGIARFTLQTPTNTGVAMLMMDIFGKDRRPTLRRLNTPALVIASSESPLLAAQKEMASTIPGSKFISLEGTGHAVFIDAAAEFEQALETFLLSAPKSENSDKGQ